MSHRFTSLLTHLIFSTKERYPFLDPEIAPECYAYLGGIIENLASRNTASSAMSDTCGSEEECRRSAAHHILWFFSFPALTRWAK